MSTTAKVSARQRIESILDDNSFVEIGALVKARSTDFILKAAHHMHDRVHLADVGKKLVAKPFALVCAAHKPCDVHKLDGCGRELFRSVHPCEHVKPLVRHGNNANVWFNGAKRVIGGLRARLGDGVKQRAFADIGESDDAELHGQFLLYKSGKRMVFSHIICIICSRASLVKRRRKRYTYRKYFFKLYSGYGWRNLGRTRCGGVYAAARYGFHCTT